MISRIGKFEILRRLGEGAMGEVFLARDPVIDREVAVKTIRKDSVALGEAKEEARERFYREARAAGGLNHPNLVTIHEFGEDQGLLYLAMEFVPGEDLATLMHRRTIDSRELLEVLAQVSDGLAHAHAKGVLHRDIKPSNIRVGRLQGKLVAKVMDFGIARIGGSDMTGTGTLLGTFGYMAPEYIQTGIPAPSADIFAVGVILYEALAGRRPFQGDTTATVLYRIVHESPAPLDLTGLPEISPALQGVAMRALEKSPAERFPSAESLAAALRGALDPDWRGPTDAVPTQRVPRPEPLPSDTTAARPSFQRHGGLLATAAAVLMLAAGSLWTWRRVEPPEPTPAPAVAPAVAPAAVTTVSAPPVPKVEVPPATQPPVSAPPAGANPSRVAATPAVTPPTEFTPPSEGVASVSSETAPAGELGSAESRLRQEPGDAKAHAIRIVTLYDSARYDEIAAALRASVAAGVPVRALFRFPRFSRMAQQEFAERRLPDTVRGQLQAMKESPPAQPLNQEPSAKTDPRPVSRPPRPRFRFRG